MTVTLDQAKIRAIGYDYRSIQDSSLIDGDAFSGTNPFLLIANKPIPLNAKVYMEVEITSTHTNKDIRHIPIYLGVHKEPSFGVLGSDCCLGSVYYTKNSYMLGPDDVSYLAFCLREKFNHQPVIYTYVNNTGGRVPLKGTTIGLGVDMIKNTITIFSDGAEFYSFSPEKFNLNNGEDYYLSVYASEYGETVSGRINYGRYETKYLPEGYTNFYQELYAKKSEHYDIDAHLTVGQKYLNPAINHDVLFGTMTVENDIAPVNVDHRRDLELVLNHPEEMVYYKNYDNSVINKHAFNFSLGEEKLEDPDMAYINYPFDPLKRLYFEFHCSGASLNDEQMGIPLTIGLTKDPNDLSKESFQVDLFHLRTDGYHIITVKDGYEFLEGNYTILNPSAPVQPDDIGILVDLAQNTIEIYTDGSLFTVVKPLVDLADFRDTTESVYFFFKTRPDKSHGEGHVICNFGTKDSVTFGNGTPTLDERPYIDDEFEFSNICDNQTVLGLWYYYNYTIKDLISKEFSVVVKVISDRIPFSKFLYCIIAVPGEADEWGPGMNTLYSTYNKINDDEEKQNEPDKSAFDINKMIEEDTDNRR